MLVDAHCPHMGAHLGYGGAIDGEGIRCPFHHWCFDADGHCVDVPYAKVAGRPPKVSLSTWLVREHSGLIMTWCSDSGQPPTWEPPLRPEFGVPRLDRLRDHRLDHSHAHPGARREHPRYGALHLRPRGRTRAARGVRDRRPRLPATVAGRDRRRPVRIHHPGSQRARPGLASYANQSRMWFLTADHPDR